MKPVPALRPKPKDQGIALFQILVLTTLLAMMALSFTSDTQDKLAQARALENRVRAQFLTDSGLALTLFHSLVPTAQRDEAYPCDASAEGSGLINWHGSSFCPLPGLTVTAQDLSGLLPVAFPQQTLWRPTLTRLGVSEAEQIRFLGELSDMQDRDRTSYRAGERETARLASGRPYPNGPFQRPSLLAELGLTPRLFNDLKKLAQTSHLTEFNPRFAPPLLLELAYGEREGRNIAAERALGPVDDARLRKIVANFPERELISFRTSGSGFLKVYLEAQVEEGRVRQEIAVELKAQEAPPFRLLHRLRP